MTPTPDPQRELLDRAADLRSGLVTIEQTAAACLVDDLMDAVKVQAAEVRRLREIADAGYELSTYVASIHWDGSRNTRDWLEGLRDAVADVQKHLPKSRGMTCNPTAAIARSQP